MQIPEVSGTDSKTDEKKFTGKDLLFKLGYDMLSGRMEVGLFFMPKIGRLRKLPRNTLTKIIKRGGSCAYKNHIGVYRMQAA